MMSLLTCTWFVTNTLFVSLVIGFILGIGLIIGHIYRDLYLWNKLQVGCTYIVMALEIIPCILILMFLCAYRPETIENFYKISIFSLCAGVCWSPLIARTIESRLQFEFDKEYARQLSMWRIAPLRTIAFKFILKTYWRDIASTLVTISIYAILTDISIGFALKNSTQIKESETILYYDDSLGQYFGEAIQSANYFDILFPLVLLALFIFSLMYVLDSLERPIKYEESYFDFIEDADNQRDQIILENNNDVTVSIGSKEKTYGGQAGGMFSLKLENALSLEDNHFMWLKGSSGSGKSLFFKALVKMLPTTGKAYGKFTHNAQDQTEIIFQEPSMYLYPYLQLGALCELMTKSTWNEVISPDVREKYKDLHTQYLSTCSAGQKRIVFTQFILHRLKNIETEGARLVLCDEPDASLDREHQQHLAEALGEVCGQENTGIIYISHNESMIERIKKKLPNQTNHINNYHVFESIRKEGTINEYAIVRRNHSLETKNFDTAKPTQNDMARKGHNNFELISEGKTTDQSNPESKPALSVHQMKITLGEQQFAFAFDKEVSFARNKVTLIEGSNGSGKSTFLKCLSGYFISRTHTLKVDDKAIRQSILTQISIWQNRVQHIAHIFDDTEKSLPHFIKIGKLIKEIRKVNKRGKKHDSTFNDFQAYLKDMIGIEWDNLRNRYPMQLSGGQRQILVYGVAKYLLSSSIILLDEPFSRLDPDKEKRLVEKMFEDVQSENKTYIIITHRPESLNGDEYEDYLDTFHLNELGCKLDPSIPHELFTPPF